MIICSTCFCVENKKKKLKHSWIQSSSTTFKLSELVGKTFFDQVWYSTEHKVSQNSAGPILANWYSYARQALHTQLVS